MIIADPQLTDRHSYGQSGLSLALTECWSDLYMRLNYAWTLRSVRPNGVFFLGDLMDGGRDWAEEEYRFLSRCWLLYAEGNSLNGFYGSRFNQELARFHTVFKTPPDYSRSLLQI